MSSEAQPDYVKQPRSRSMSSRSLLLVLAALVLLIASASTLIYYMGVYVPARSKAEATAVANMHLAWARATGTAQAAATMQANVDATATTIVIRQSSYERVIQGQPILNDSLAVPVPGRSNWVSGQGCTFTGGSYHASEARKGFFWPCSEQTMLLSNFAYQVQMKIIKGDAGGIIFRANATISRFYVFRVSQDGTYDIYYYSDGTGKGAQKLAEGYSSLITDGTHNVNQLTVLARDSTIFLYINGKYLAGMQHKGPTSGFIGVIADSSMQPTEVAYSQMRVWKL